jgi:hypothetical protein
MNMEREMRSEKRDDWRMESGGWRARNNQTRLCSNAKRVAALRLVTPILP